MTRWQKTDWLVLAVLVLIAAFFRLWRLSDTPPGFQFDEAYNAADALRVLAGERPLFFEANGGREALHIYWIAPFVALLGPTAIALRLASAIAGIATVALSYVLWRRLLPHGERLVAALASLLLAILYWHVHFSRYGIRAILLPLLLIPVVYFLWSATQPGERREWLIARAARNWRAAAQAPLAPLVLCGLFVGLSLYAHPAARFIPVLVVAWFGWLLLSSAPAGPRLPVARTAVPDTGGVPPAGTRLPAARTAVPNTGGVLPAGTRPQVASTAVQDAKGVLPAGSPLRYFAPLPNGRLLTLARSLAVIAGAAFVVFLPLGMYFLQHPQSFLGHPTVVAITDQRVSEGNVLTAFGANAIRVAGMFFISGDQAWIHNLAGRPVFDWGIAIFFVAGCVVWARKLRGRDPLAVLLLLWLPLMLLPTLLSDAAPNYSRAIGVLPALCLIPAWGMSAAYSLLRDGVHRLGLAPYALRFTPYAFGFGLGAVMLASAWTTFDDYFGRFPYFAQTYYAYDMDKIADAQHLIDLTRTERVFVPPLLAQHATFALLTRAAGLKSFDNGEIMVLPARDPQQGMVYAFSADADPAYLDEFQRTYGALAVMQPVPDALGKPMLYEYRIAAQSIPAAAEALPASLPIAPQRLVNANFGGEIRFVGYRVVPPPDGDHPFLLTLVWQVLQPVPRDYTLFIHLTDAGGKGISQRDRRPGNGSYPTTVWAPGDITIETYEVWPRNASGPLQFAVGWYDVADGSRLPVLDAGGKPIDDQVVLPAEGTQ